MLLYLFSLVILEITGNKKVGFLEEDLDDDFDPKKYDQLMQVRLVY